MTTPTDRPRLLGTILQVIAALIVADILWRHLPAEIGTRGWTPTAYALIATIIAITGAVCWAVLGRGRRHRR